MDSKGQFSIIAALLVAVVLVATVIMTYSMIRAGFVQVQPQILSTVEETHIALKEILGFTVGYYGSILKVTGNSTYAKELAIEYAKSGLERLAQTYPELGASFNLSSVDLSTYWYGKRSWSRGKLVVDYSLAGLGLHGMCYATSCELEVQVVEVSSNQTKLKVTKDGGEPLLSLTKQSFKFYRYNYENSTWTLVSPSKDPCVDPNGIYTIDMNDQALASIDKHAYIVQVEDPRGLIAVVSSFNKYTITLDWNSTMFYAPTGTVNATLIDHESFESTTWPPTGWNKTGNWYRYQRSWNRPAYDGSWMAGIVGSSSGWLMTPNINCYGVTAIYVEFYYRDEGCDQNEFLLQYSMDGGKTWTTVSDLGATTNENQWLCYQQKITDSRYFTQSFKIRWYANLDSGERAYVDYVTVMATVREPPPTVVVELLQNGTMRWLGQNLQLTTQAKPIPPIPVKSIRVNQTINGISREVPFQIEDWASDYKIPLGLASNASVFSNRNMLVFLVNPSVEKVTIWWDGSDTAVQTPYAYTNRYFMDDPPTFSNRILTLRFSSGQSAGFRITATRGSMTTTADLMRINDEEDDTDPEWWWTLYNGVVRDIVQGEPEYGGGADRNGTCYNVYAHVVITLPANATYYTYQLRLIFLNSTDKPRTITQIRPIRITASGTFSALTENGTLPSGYPRVSGSGFFYNFSTSCWQHRWAQLASSSKGFGIMFTDEANKMLYHFDNGTIKRGALKVINSTTERAIELLPVSHERPQITNHVSPLDICWYGAVAVFDGTTPIYRTINGVPTGLWVLVEYPPIISVVVEG